MGDVWVALIGVFGALTGSLTGAWMAARVARQSQETMNRQHYQRETREAFCEALSALLAYRAAELKRIHDAVELGITVDDASVAAAARELRSACGYHEVVLKVLMPSDDIPHHYSTHLKRAREISKQETLEQAIVLSRSVRSDIEALAGTYGVQHGLVSHAA